MSDGIVRVVAGDEAALRIIVRQQRAEIDRLQISARRIRGANKRLAAANVRLMSETARLAAEVERLRMTDKERDAIEDCADAAEAYMNDDIAATLRALNDRHDKGGAA